MNVPNATPPPSTRSEAEIVAEHALTGEMLWRAKCTTLPNNLMVTESHEVLMLDVMRERLLKFTVRMVRALFLLTSITASTTAPDSAERVQ